MDIHVVLLDHVLYSWKCIIFKHGPIDHNNGSYNLHSVLSPTRFEGRFLLLDPKREKQFERKIFMGEDGIYTHFKKLLGFCIR